MRGNRDNISSSSTTRAASQSTTTKKSRSNQPQQQQQQQTKTTKTTTKSSSSSSSSWWGDDQSYYTSSTANKLILTSVLSQFLPVPLLLLPFLHLVYGCLASLWNIWRGGGKEVDNDEEEDDDSANEPKRSSSSSAVSGGGRRNSNNSATSNNTTDEETTTNTTTNEQEEYQGTIDIDDYDPKQHIQVPPTPALTTLLDAALYKSYQGELVPTVSACGQLLQLYIEMKEVAALIVRECRWCVGVPLSGGLVTTTTTTTAGGTNNNNNRGGNVVNDDDGNKIAIGGGSQNVFLGGGVVVDEFGNNVVYDGNSDNGAALPMMDDGSIGSGIGSSLFLRRGTSGSIVESINSTSNTSNSSSSVTSKEARLESMAAMEIAKWNEFDTIQDFAQQCYLSANEAIQRLSTDRLSDSANLTVHDGLSGEVGGGGGGGGNNNSRDGSGNHHQAVTPGDALNHHHDQSQTHHHHSMPSSAPTAATVGPSSSSSSSAAQSSSMFPKTLADAGIGRCYEPLTRQGCWESPRLYCPDYTWADDAIGSCQRSLKILSKHRFLTLVATNGWDRYTNITTLSSSSTSSAQQDGTTHILPTPIYASSTPHPFPSLEAVHALQYLVSELLYTSIPSSINKFRAATEANAVVSKRLYLVKCEYRAPMRALWESYTALNAAPRLELVETYLRDYHGVKIGEEQDTTTSSSSSSTQQQQGGGGGGSSRSSVLKKKLSSDASKKSALLQQQREKMEKLITEKYWKHPIFVEALQLERCCEKLEMDMSQMLLPLANLAREIMDEWKGRIRALAVVREDESGRKFLQPYINWHQLPLWRELLRRLKSILCRKPCHDESTGIRPFLLDLQGVPRHNKDAVDSSIEITLYTPLGNDASNPYLEEFVRDVQVLQKVLNIPGMPVLAEERLSGSKSDKATMLELVKKFNEVWDEEMFLAQYKDWYDLVKRQQELNAGTVSEDGEQQPSLSELAEAIRETEIELSIAMASKDQLDMVRKRLEDLRSSKAKRHAVLASIVQDVGMRELDEIIVVSPPEDDATAEFPELSELGLFGDQLTMSGEVLPLG